MSFSTVYIFLLSLQKGFCINKSLEFVISESWVFTGDSNVLKKRHFHFFNIQNF